ncbi:MAG: ATP synthase epsilon chain [Calditrichaeota bacterium]|nr:ATP synthase epsilon chain [Calditrichota bacterium]
MPDTIKLEIISPSGLVYQDDVRHVQAPGEMGYFGVLNGHTPMISALDVGRITADRDGGRDLFATSGGVAEVHADSVIILAETAERRSQIDVDRAEAAKQRAEQRLHSHDPTVDFERASTALMRAFNRIRVARGV